MEFDFETYLDLFFIKYLLKDIYFFKFIIDSKWNDFKSTILRLAPSCQRLSALLLTVYLTSHDIHYRIDAEYGNETYLDRAVDCESVST